MSDGTVHDMGNIHGIMTGPAHSIYFVTYEMAMEASGGNDQLKHHAFASGRKFTPSILTMVMLMGIKGLSGACATVASDAFMNPFDGRLPRLHLMRVSNNEKWSSKECKLQAQQNGRWLPPLERSIRGKAGGRFTPHILRQYA